MINGSIAKRTTNQKESTAKANHIQADATAQPAQKYSIRGNGNKTKTATFMEEATAEVQSHESLAVTFYELRFCQKNKDKDKTIMAVVCAMMKALLKSTTKLEITSQEHEIELPIITRTSSTLPNALETRVIRKYIHKGNITHGNFSGVIKASC